MKLNFLQQSENRLADSAKATNIVGGDIIHIIKIVSVCTINGAYALNTLPVTYNSVSCFYTPVLLFIINCVYDLSQHNNISL